MPVPEYIGRAEGGTNSVTSEKPITNGTTLTDGDLVALTNGRLVLATTQVLGQITGGSTKLTSKVSPLTGDAAGTVKVLVNIERDARYLMKCSAAVATTDEGNYFNLTAGSTTGNQTVDVASKSATAGVLYLETANPGIRGTDNTYGIFRLGNKQEVEE